VKKLIVLRPSKDRHEKRFGTHDGVLSATLAFVVLGVGLAAVVFGTAFRAKAGIVEARHLPFDGLLNALNGE
jgi:hypothetical protein